MLTVVRHPRPAQGISPLGARAVFMPHQPYGDRERGTVVSTLTFLKAEQAAGVAEIFLKATLESVLIMGVAA